MYDDENQLVCPYCGEMQYNHDPDEISAYLCNTECEHCGKLFWYSVKVTREYFPTRDDSDEGEEDSDG